MASLIFLVAGGKGSGVLALVFFFVVVRAVSCVLPSIGLAMSVAMAMTVTTMMMAAALPVFVLLATAAAAQKQAGVAPSSSLVTAECCAGSGRLRQSQGRGYHDRSGGG